jgi:hypothetical protein
MLETVDWTSSTSRSLQEGSSAAAASRGASTAKWGRPCGKELCGDEGSEPSKCDCCGATMSLSAKYGSADCSSTRIPLRAMLGSTPMLPAEHDSNFHQPGKLLCSCNYTRWKRLYEFGGMEIGGWMRDIFVG